MTAKKSEMIYILSRETKLSNGQSLFQDIGYYTMRSLVGSQVRYLNGTVETKGAIIYSSREVEANHDFSH